MSKIFDGLKELTNHKRPSVIMREEPYSTSCPMRRDLELNIREIYEIITFKMNRSFNTVLEIN